MRFRVLCLLLALLRHKLRIVVLVVLSIAMLMCANTSLVQATVDYTVSSETYEWDGYAPAPHLWGDDEYMSYTLPFVFPFYGTTYTTIYIGTNGYITLDSGETAYDVWPHFLAHPMIAVMGEDLMSTYLLGGVYVREYPNYVNVLWYMQPKGMGPDRDLMLVRLYDTGNIFVSYADWVSPDIHGSDAVAGVSKGDGSTYITISPSDETAFLFTYISLEPGVPEFSLTIPVVTSLAATIYLALRKRIGKKPE